MKETLVEEELILITGRAIVVMTKATPRGARARARASARAPQGWARTMEVASKRAEAREAHHREEADADAAGHLGSTIRLGEVAVLLSLLKPRRWTAPTTGRSRSGAMRRMGSHTAWKTSRATTGRSGWDRGR